jgi:hypothetical protein
MASHSQGYLLRALAGGAGGALAYLAAQTLDLALLGNGSNDLKLLGMAVTRRAPFWQLLGLAAHFSFGALLGVVYAATAARWLPGSSWQRGLLFAQLENALLGVLLLPLIDRFHPAIRAGLLPPYLRPLPLLQQIFRHAAYGATLGLIAGDRGGNR